MPATWTARRRDVQVQQRASDCSRSGSGRACRLLRNSRIENRERSSLRQSLDNDLAFALALHSHGLLLIASAFLHKDHSLAVFHKERLPRNGTHGALLLALDQDSGGEARTQAGISASELDRHIGPVHRWAAKQGTHAHTTDCLHRSLELPVRQCVEPHRYLL